MRQRSHSLFLAKEFGVPVYATDLWISATENYERFKDLGLADQIIPIHADCNDLPFAHEYLDCIICVDEYYSFGREAGFMDEKLAPFVKRGGTIALTFPGFKEEIHAHLPAKFCCHGPQRIWKHCTAVHGGRIFLRNRR